MFNLIYKKDNKKMNRFLTNSNIKTKHLNKTEFNNFLNNCKRVNILKVIKNNNLTQVKFIHNNIEYFIAEIKNNWLEYGYKINKEFTINYDLNRISNEMFKQ